MMVVMGRLVNLFTPDDFATAKIAGMFQSLDELLAFRRYLCIGIIRPSSIETADRQKHENREEHPINFCHCSPLWFQQVCIQAVLARLHSNGLYLGLNNGHMV